MDSYAVTVLVFKCYIDLQLFNFISIYCNILLYIIYKSNLTINMHVDKKNSTNKEIGLILSNFPAPKEISKYPNGMTLS